MFLYFEIFKHFWNVFYNSKICFKIYQFLQNYYILQIFEFLKLLNFFKFLQKFWKPSIFSEFLKIFISNSIFLNFIANYLQNLLNISLFFYLDSKLFQNLSKLLKIFPVFVNF
jgi:hypothetical protein